MEIAIQNKLIKNVKKLDDQWTFELDPDLKYDVDNPVAKLFAEELQKEIILDEFWKT